MKLEFQIPESAPQVWSFVLAAIFEFLQFAVIRHAVFGFASRASTLKLRFTAGKTRIVFIENKPVLT